MTAKVNPAWCVVDGHLVRTYKRADFKGALELVNRIGALAERANHHPDIELSWGKVVVKLFTHDENKIGDKDYALAADIDALGS